MKVIEIAQEIYTSLLNSPTDLSVSSIAYYLREQVGELNNLLSLELTIGTDAQFSEDLTEAQKAVYKQLYMLHYYDIKIQESLGAASVDSTLEISDFGTTVRKSSKIQLSQEWRQLKKSTQEMLDKQVQNYHGNKVTPLGVHGDDTTVSTNGGLSDCLNESF